MNEPGFARRGKLRRYKDGNTVMVEALCFVISCGAKLGEVREGATYPPTFQVPAGWHVVDGVVCPTQRVKKLGPDPKAHERRADRDANQQRDRVIALTEGQPIASTAQPARAALRLPLVAVCPECSRQQMLDAQHLDLM